jgi:anti-sigma regulatory factor (Ser/Thr protein kinase)
VGRFTALRELASGLGTARHPDEVARVALSCATRLPGVLRAGVALNQGAGRQLRFVASERLVAGDGDAVSAQAVRWCHIDGLANVPLVRTVRSGSPVFVPSLDHLGRDYPQMVDRQRALGTRSMATLPLGPGPECLGGLLLSFDTESAFDDEGAAFLSAFSAQVGEAMRRALDHQTQETTAEQLQRSLMAHSLPDLDGLALGAHYHSGALAAEVGGDWYDVLPLDDGSAVVAVGDVMGKGSSAAVVMGQIRAATRAYALLDPSPAVLLSRLDSLVRSLAVPEQLVTMACGLVAPDRRQMSLALAGHPPPLLLPAEGTPTVLQGIAGPPLGLDAGPWSAVDIAMQDHVTVLLYSNGLVETRQVDVLSGLARLSDDLAQLDPARRGPRELCARLGDLAWDRDIEDDVTILAVSRTNRRRLNSATKDLPADPSAVPLARHFVTRRITEWGVDPEVAGTAELCVSELVTNAVIHAGTPSHVTVRLDDQRLLVAVRDHGRPEAVAPVEAEVEELSTGRGLTIVEVLAASWGSERGLDGATVWFELDLR